MKSRNRTTLDDKLMVAYLEGETTDSEQEAIEMELARSPATQRRLEDLRRLRAQLFNTAPDFENVDLVADVWQRIEQSETASHAGAWSSRWWSKARGWGGTSPWLAAVAVLAIAFVAPKFWSRSTGDTRIEEDVRAKGVARSSAEQWAGIAPYVVTPTGVRRLRERDEMSRSSELVFSYTNLGSQTKFGFLMVFAIDARGDVRWYYPAYETPSDDPRSITIKRHVADEKLASAVRHDFATGPLTLVGLFSQRPLRIRNVEQTVKRLLSEGGLRGENALKFPFEDVSTHAVELRVVDAEVTQPK